LPIGSVLVFAGAFTAAGHRVLHSPPNQLLATVAGIGSAIFISYSVGISGLVRQIRRGADAEVLLGFLTGLSISGIFGVGLAAILIGIPKPLGWLGEMALAWTGSSLILLAGLVAALPLFAYDGSRLKHLNADE
jgi:hypothetical protein